ncbi:rod-binding protein [Phenylobacterium sp.]|uniref:rod-binding protein n=1 Tax=Phenylobacterium sp. TaxID=1871053 RepID=UPI002DE549F7|nr:rod-binding protein [Phenylobacterium sp.]
MSDISAMVIPPSLTAPPAAPSAAELAKRGQIKRTAQDFEASFLSVMMQQMFAGVSTDGPFGGGQGEEMFRSVLTDAMSKQMVKVGGIGIAPTVEREMLKLQGLK